jgi:hypothetical protein
VLLGLEVPVDAGPGDADGRADLVDAGRVETLVVEELGGFGEDPLAAVPSPR